MLQLFRPKCPVDAHQKAWIEVRMAWLCQQFGIDRMLEREVVLPSDSMFLEFDGSEETAQILFDDICRQIEIDPKCVALEFHSQEELRFLGVYDAEGSKTTIRVAEAQLDDFESLIATFVHELSHHLLLGGNRLSSEESDHEYVTDLMAVYLGFGIFSANSTIRESSNTYGRWHSWSVRKQGYLTAREYGYALALYSYLRDQTAQEWSQILRLDVRVALDAGLKYIGRTGDCIFRETLERGSRPNSDEELLEKIGSRFDGARVAALWQIDLLKSPSEEIVQAVGHCLVDNNCVIRSEAAETLGKLGASAQSAFEKLTACLRDEELEVRGTAVSALSRIRSDAATLSQLAEMIDDDNSWVVSQALAAIATYGTDASYLVDRLLPMLRDSLVRCDYQVAEWLVWTISQATADVSATINQFFGDDRDLNQLAIDFLENQREDTLTKGEESPK